MALSEVTEENGCVRMLAGSHIQGSASAASSDPENLLSAGLQFEVSDAEAARAAPVILRSGEISIHDGMIVHGSGANRSAMPRIGLAFVYIPAHVRQTSAPDRHVVLVRGAARNDGFNPADPPPEGDEAAQLTAAGDYFRRLKRGEIRYNVR